MSRPLICGSSALLQTTQYSRPDFIKKYLTCIKYYIMANCIFHNSDNEFLSKESFATWMEQGFQDKGHPNYKYWQTARPLRLSAGDKIIFAYGSKELKYTWLVGEAKVFGYRLLGEDEKWGYTVDTKKLQKYKTEYDINPDSVVIYAKSLELTPTILANYLPRLWDKLKPKNQKKAGGLFRLGIYITPDEYRNIEKLSKQNKF